MFRLTIDSEKRVSRTSRAIGALLLALASACGPIEDIEAPGLLSFFLAGTGRGRVGVVTSDLGPAGRFTLMTPEGIPLPGGENIHSDAVVRYWNGKVYIVNRLNRDNIQILDPDFAYRTVQEFSVGEKTNPHDIAFVDENRAYISLYERDYVLVVDPSRGVELQRVSLAGFADPSDGIPEMSGMHLEGERLYVAIQRLDRNNTEFIFPPTDFSSLLEIDARSGSVLAEHRMQSQNPFSKLRVVLIDGARHLYWANPNFLGFNFRIDGGVEAFNLETRSFRPGFLYAESAAGGDILDVVIRDAVTGYALVLYQDFSLSLQRFDPSTGSFARELAFYPASAGYVSGLLLSDAGYLYAADASFAEPGIIIYDTRAGDRRITPQPIPVGLRPTDLVYIP